MAPYSVLEIKSSTSATKIKYKVGGVIKMSFSEMLDLLKKREKGNIVFVKIGTFYVTAGEDAVLIHKKLNLKCTCYKKNICKVEFPVVAFEKYVEKLN